MPSSVRRPAPRTYDPVRVRKALTAQVETIEAAAHRITPEQLTLPSGLPGWDVHTLLVHIALQIDALPRLLSMPEPAASVPEVDLSTWARSTAGKADELDREHPRGGRARHGPGAARVDEAVEELEPVLESAVRADVLLPHGFGAMRALDFTVTRLVELVVHSDDLTRATGVRVPLDRMALASVCAASDRHAGGEGPGPLGRGAHPAVRRDAVRRGPRHTRGTPPNVVETDPLTWMRLATGRTTWADARSRRVLQASGDRADISEHLPVLG